MKRILADRQLQRLWQLNQPGCRLPGALQRRLGDLLGDDLSDVRIHLSDVVSRMGANALTIGREIFFAPTAYDPDSSAGRMLIAHEMLHACRHSQRQPTPRSNHLVIVDDPVLESEAQGCERAALDWGANPIAAATASHGPLTLPEGYTAVFPSYKTVVVIGAGPIGMLAAIEAKQHFKNVVMIEKREAYTRKNVPTINRNTGMRQHVSALSQTRNRLTRRQAVDMNLWGADMKGKDLPLSELEQALHRKAQAINVDVKRGFVLTGIVGNDKKANQRYKTITLTYRAYDPQTSQPAGPGLVQLADLLVVAFGGGASSDPLITGTLGFDYEKLNAENYGAYATYQPGEVQDRPPKDLGKYKMAKDISQANTMVPGDTHNYLLSTLENCTAADFEVLRTQAPVLQSMMENMGKQFGRGFTEHINNGQKDIGVFTIQLQRARQFMSAEYPAVMVGDAACQPHPAAGSGIACGFQGFEQLKLLYEALARVHRSADNGQAFNAFNNHMEPIVAKKALEGTKWVTLEILRMLEKHHQEVEALKSTLAGSDKPNSTKVFDLYIDQSTVLIQCMKDHRENSTNLYDGHPSKYDECESPVTALWADLDSTYVFVKAATDGYSSLVRRVQQMG